MIVTGLMLFKLVFYAIQHCTQAGHVNHPKTFQAFLLNRKLSFCSPDCHCILILAWATNKTNTNQSTTAGERFLSKLIGWLSYRLWLMITPAAGVQQKPRPEMPQRGRRFVEGGVKSRAGLQRRQTDWLIDRHWYRAGWAMGVPSQVSDVTTRRLNHWFQKFFWLYKCMCLSHILDL